MNIKCITFDKQAQDALPEEIKAKMKADREKAIRNRQLKKMEKLSKQGIGRVILYRGKKEVSKEWVYGFLTVKPSYGNTQAYYIEYVEEFYKDGKFNGLKHHSHLVTPETIGQFTGLKDKNGVEIYEGDIFKFAGLMNEVRFEKGCFLAYQNDEQMGIIAEYPHMYEVVGNIFDNKELTKHWDYETPNDSKF